MGATVPGHQPEAGLAAGLGAQALGRSLEPQGKGQGVEGDGVLQKDRPIGGNGEVVQKGEAVKAVAAFAEQLAGLGAIGGELHQADGAARAALDAEADHAGGAVVTGIKAGVGTEGLTGLENPVQQTDAPGFETVGIEGVGRTGLPKRQKVVAKAHHMGVGDVFEPQVKGVGQGAAGLLGAENAAVEITTGLFLRLPALGAHETVAEAQTTALEAQGGDHAVAIKGVVDPMAGAL